MAASTSPFTVEGTLTFPPEDGLQPAPIPFGVAGQFTSLSDVRLALTGSGTKSVDFGTIAKAKALLVEYDADALAAVVNLHVNGGNDDIELAPGGFIMYGNPSPSVGITQLSIDYTSAAAIRVRLLG